MAVVDVDELSAEPYAGGRDFGPVGPAVIRRLHLGHAVDPAHPANRSIVDLELADRDEQGRVRFDHDVIVVQPAEAAARNGWALVDVVNRGAPTIPGFLMGDDSPLFPQPPEPPVGDGSLLAEGFTLVYAGWQFDIAAPAALGLRAPEAREHGRPLQGRVSYTVVPSVSDTRLPLSSPGHWVWPLAPGSSPLVRENGVELSAGECRLSGSGSALVRAEGFRAGCTYVCEFDTVGARVGGCGLLALRDTARWLRAEEGIRRALLFGVSQSGRCIRQFLGDGMNVDEAGAQAYDAMLPVIAGGRRGRFNARFAVPGALPAGPDGVDEDGRYGALLQRSDEAGVTPRVIAVNTSSEYWRGDAGLVHGDPHPAVRVHHVAGTQHPPGIVPQLFTIPVLGWRGQHGFNTVDYRPVVRALLAQLVGWVDHDVPPSPDTVPEASQLGERQAVLEQFRRLGRATPRPASLCQPAGPVPAVDAVGNEVGGIRLPDVAAPIGVHTGWNVRHPTVGAPEDEVFLMGSTWWFDELPPLDAHLEAARRVIDGLVERRLLRAADTDLVLAHAEARWHAVRAAHRSAGPSS